MDNARLDDASKWATQVVSTNLAPIRDTVISVESDDSHQKPPSLQLQRSQTTTFSARNSRHAVRRSQGWVYPSLRSPRSATETPGMGSYTELPDPQPTEPTEIDTTSPIARPRRAAQPSWYSRASRHLSITPGEMVYPTSMLRMRNPEDFARAEALLGLKSLASPLPQAPLELLPTLPDYDKPLPPKPLPPQNGRRAWLHALTGMLIVFNVQGFSSAMGVFQAYYELYYLPTHSPATIAWIGGTQLALVFGLGVPVGRLVDRGYFRVVFHSGAGLLVLGMFLTSLCKTWWSLWLVQGVLTGLGMGMSFCSGMVAMMPWFDERTVGQAMGLGAAGSCLGGIVYTLLARHFLQSNGFATTMRIIAAVACVTMVPSQLVFRMREQKHRDVRAGRRGSRVLVSKKEKKKHSDIPWHIFAEPAYLLAGGGMFFAYLGLYFGFVYIVTYGHAILHLSDTAATNLLIYMLVANLPGRFLPALISDKCIGPLTTLIPSTLLSAAVIWLWAASPPTQSSLTVIACFYGFVCAGIQVLYAPAIYSFCLEPAAPRPHSAASTASEESDEQQQSATDRLGLKAGGIFTVVGLACLIGNPIGGALIEYRTARGLDRPFFAAQCFAGSCLLVACGFLILSRWKKVGWAAKRA